MNIETLYILDNVPLLYFKYSCLSYSFLTKLNQKPDKKILRRFCKCQQHSFRLEIHFAPTFLHKRHNKLTQYFYGCICRTTSSFVGCLTRNCEFIQSSASNILKLQHIMRFSSVFYCYILAVNTPSKGRFWWTISIACQDDAFSFLNFFVSWMFYYTRRD